MNAGVDRLTAALADRYHIERVLGAGGMATVYLARDLKHDRLVALKVLRDELSAALGADRFLQEIRISARLDHPHILTLIDSGRVDGILYYVLPFVRGESLRAKLNREKQLSIDEALAITRQVASALGYAHAHGVVHRDIKPENILLHEGEAVVADFGIALALKEAGGARFTGTGLSLGTPHYMSPEQATGDRTIDGRSDVYSLGAVLYEMLAGEPPHTGATAQAVIAKLLVERPTRLRVVRDTIPEYLDEAVQRALAKTPADRFATASAFALAVNQPVEVKVKARHWIGLTERARAWRLVVAAGVLALGISAAVLLARRRAAGDADASRSDPRRLAVLYFRTTTDSLQPIADGLTEDLIRELSQVRTLRVVSANGVLSFRDPRIGRDSIRRALEVGSLVEGTVARSGAHLRVNVSLVDAADGTVLGSTAIEQPLGRVFELQDSVTSTVALFLRRRLGEEITMREQRRGTGNADAWRLVQEARTAARVFDSLLVAGDSALARAQLARADSLLGQAIQLEPRWTKPLTERGWLAWRSRNLTGNLNTTWTDDWTTRAIRFASSALELAPGNPDALALRGTARYFRHVFNLGSDPRAVSAAGDSAETDLRSAGSADPNQAYAWSLLSHRLMRTGKTAEAKLAALQAYEADAYARDASVVLWRLYSASLDLGDRIESTRWCNEGARRFPADPVFLECQITVQALPGQRPDVPSMWKLLERNVALYPASQREYRRKRGEIFVAMTLVRAGLPDSARAVALRARGDASIDPSRDLVNLEIPLRNMLGDRDEALRLAAVYFAANPQDRRDCGGGVQQDDQTWWMRGLVEDPRYRVLSCTGR